MTKDGTSAMTELVRTDSPPRARRTVRRTAWRTAPRVAALALAALGLATAAAGCAAGPRSAARDGATAPHAAGHPAAAAHAVARQRPRASAACNPVASSLAPAGPPVVTPGSYMAQIKQRGYLIAGVDQSTYHFGYLNPLDGKIEGFDIDMIRAVAKAIFGDPDKVQYKAISDADRIPAVTSGSVDIVAHTMTITCDRLAQVDFSSVYFDAHQRVLIPADSKATNGLAGLAGEKVCATNGSDSVTTIEHYPTHPKVVQRPFWTDCLVLLQQDQVAAISTDDAILYGLQAQDPFTKVVGPELSDEPYGLAMSKHHTDFVRFVNAVIAEDESDHAWENSYKRWVSPAGTTPPTPRYAG